MREIVWVAVAAVSLFIGAITVAIFSDNFGLVVAMSSTGLGLSVLSLTSNR